MVTARPGSAAQSAAQSRARGAVARVVDPELPMLTLVDLGVVREIGVSDDGTAVAVTITPTYTGCPAVETMADDLRAGLHAAGFARVEVRTAFAPTWSTDRISPAGRRKLAAHGIAPPARVGPRGGGPIPLTLTPPSATVRCPRCGCPGTEELSGFGPTPCTALRRCVTCREPFQHMKQL